MIVKTEEDINGLKEIGRICAAIRDELVSKTVPGITTKELDEIAGVMFEKEGAVSAPKGEYDFPGYTCISVNEEVAHGIPGDRVIQEGDLVNIDVSGSKNGYFADTGISIVVGDGNEVLKNLCNTAKLAFEAGIKKAKPGSRITGLGKVVYQTARQRGFNVIMNLTGHGIGRTIHEEPEYIYNYYEPSDSGLLKDGMVIAFEPFISTDEEEVFEKGDGWTYITEQSFVAQYEHTMILTKNGPIITTL
ncbi:type I methionyl aminopeptidase [Neobacillus mesonae]|uniref:type I methionyl aminopeptidase n=1 Tax=Neobacillus mesonae TaxID=1193713 RepID=UPI002041CCAF|nr:type I methionyl aminopeptidase [Neobacillus mesonae]MCM3570392.1 type I methionyl aminopeptidase [Neobacillus mesonae]